MSQKIKLGRVGLVPKGEYSDGSSYKRLDFVLNNGSSFVALKDTTGVPPTEEHTFPYANAESAVWGLLASQGNQGRDGNPGVDGRPGEDGKPGKDGVDGKSYVILGPVYETEEALKMAVTDPVEGDRYEVGTKPPYDVYRYTGVGDEWVNEGTLYGDGGEGGPELSDAAPQPLDKASPGTSDEASRADHVHKMPTAAEIGARPDDWMPTAAEVGARAADWTPTAAEVGARPDDWTPTAEGVGALPADTAIPKINGSTAMNVTFSLDGTVLTITVSPTSDDSE